ncbi:cyclin-dependent kinase inhibitor 3 family protein [Marinobacterium rhizophilum]|uniref:Cyclin-dependent kinase inhibitor 3 family protein n=1 Tax=Marinobacterium rhizophilum TaxID=420402 RepID=A0ABY5HEW2_9GAMM|nr:cyclin-dependent kinase inhibitor 3 family protein [Marinobacterium rhizophilum]UTW10891.1 cyclin-dependent kinase inhibitor 3 family protein [Marinobacterium rhizophilum]
MHTHPYSVLDADPIRGQLIFTPCPGTRETSLDDALDTLKAAGASALLTLMPAEELARNQAENLPEQCKQRGIEWFHLPVEDDQAPAAPFQLAWKAHRQHIRQLLIEGKNIAIHCKGGSGRTGLIAAQLLIECGVPLQQAIDKVQALRPRAIQSTDHVNYIRQLEFTEL